MFCPPYLLKVSHDLPLFLEYYQGPKFHLPRSAYSFSFCISTHFHSVHQTAVTLALCLCSKHSRCSISLACLSSWLPSYIVFWTVFIINNNISQKRNLGVILVHDLKRNRIQYVGKGREEGYEAAGHTLLKLGNREK